MKKKVQLKNNNVGHWQKSDGNWHFSGKMRQSMAKKESIESPIEAFYDLSDHFLNVL